jgi:hypothetical protein
MAHIVQVVAIDGPDNRRDEWRVLSATTYDAATTADNATATNLCSAGAIPILAAPVLATVAASVAILAVTGPVAGA